MHGCRKIFEKQIVAALDPEYVQQFRDYVTNTICTDIPTILGHLFNDYGTIMSKELTTKEEKVKG